MYKVDDDETFLQCLANNKDDTLTITPSLCLIAKDYFYVKNMYSGVYDDKIISALNKYIKKCKIGTEFEVVRRQDNKSLYDVNYMGSRKCYDVTSTLTHDNNRSFAVIYPDGNLILFCGAQTCRNFRTTIDYGVDPSNIDNQLINEKMLQQAEQLEINNKKYANQSTIIISNFISNLQTYSTELCAYADKLNETQLSHGPSSFEPHKDHFKQCVDSTTKQYDSIEKTVQHILNYIETCGFEFESDYASQLPTILLTIQQNYNTIIDLYDVVENGVSPHTSINISTCDDSEDFDCTININYETKSSAISANYYNKKISKLRPKKHPEINTKQLLIKQQLTKVELNPAEK